MILISNSLLVAIESGNTEAFESFWDDSIIGFKNDNGWTLAHFAMITWGNEIRNRLLLYNIPWNISTAIPQFNGAIPEELATIQGLTPLHLASWCGIDPSITFLYENKLIVDINILTPTADHYSALHLASIFNWTSTLKLLHRYGADLDMVDGIDHRTALHYAANRGHHESVTALLEAGCKPNEPDIHGMTPELLAIDNGHQPVIQVFSKHLDSLEAKKSFSFFC